MNNKSQSHHPKRIRRLSRVFNSPPSFFLTICVANRESILPSGTINERVFGFITSSLEKYGVWVDSYVLMPDHVHLIVCFSSSTDCNLGQWVKAFKACVARREFRWQAGFFDHVLRSDESRWEKWRYIRENPVRAGLIAKAEDWPYAAAFHPQTGKRVT